MEYDTSINQILLKTLNFSSERDYLGYDKHDGMSSRILQKIPFDNKWINLIFQEAAKRAPINIRPLLLVKKRRSIKGACLFTLANLNAFDLTNNTKYIEEAKTLIDWVVKNRIKKKSSGFCIGHNHEVQGLNKKTTPSDASVVATSDAVRALLKSSEYLDNKKYAKIARTSSKVIFEDLDYTECNNGSRIKYKPISSGDSYTLNANAMGARLLIDLYQEFGDKKYFNSSTKIFDYVVSNQTEMGGWMYTEPPSASHLNMDNYHNGFIIESLLDYKEITNSNRFDRSLNKALKLYKTSLYNEDGSPHWDEKSEYPKDIHAAAQGIIVFTKVGDLEFARKIMDWTLENLYAGEGKFYYQKRRFYTKKFTLMRWCQAWMAYAISKYIISLSK